MDKGTGVTTAWVPGALKQCWGHPMTHPSHSSFLFSLFPAVVSQPGLTLCWDSPVLSPHGCPDPCPHPREHEPREPWWHWWHWCDELWVLWGQAGFGC